LDTDLRHSYVHMLSLPTLLYLRRSQYQIFFSILFRLEDAEQERAWLQKNLQTWKMGSTSLAAPAPRRLFRATKGCKMSLSTTGGALRPGTGLRRLNLLGGRPIAGRTVSCHLLLTTVLPCQDRCRWSAGDRWADMSLGFANRVMEHYLLLLLSIANACGGCSWRRRGSQRLLGGGKYWVLSLRFCEFHSSYSSLDIVSIHLHTLLYANTV